MAGLHGIPAAILPYDTDRYDLRPPVQEALEEPDLATVHRRLGFVAMVSRSNDQATEAHKRFYNGIGTDFYRRYHDFIRSFVVPLVGEEVVFQRVPTFRVHLPGNLAVGEFHKDTDYSHLPNAVTFWLPLTDAYGSNTIQVELGGQAQPLPVPYGHVLAFDSMNLRHGNLVNETDHTRVSMDFRVIPRSEFVPSDRTSINTGMVMDIGGYYDEDRIPSE